MDTTLLDTPSRGLEAIQDFLGFSGNGDVKAVEIGESGGAITFIMARDGKEVPNGLTVERFVIRMLPDDKLDATYYSGVIST